MQVKTPLKVYFIKGVFRQFDVLQLPEGRDFYRKT